MYIHAHTHQPGHLKLHEHIPIYLHLHTFLPLILFIPGIIATIKGCSSIAPPAAGGSDLPFPLVLLCVA